MWAHLDNQIWQALVTFAWNLLVTAILVVIGLWMTKWLLHVLDRFMKEKNVDPTIMYFANSAVQVILYGLIVIEALFKLGVQSSSLIAIVGATGVSIGLAMKGHLSNVSAGLLMILFRPFAVGHYIQIGKIEGTVEKIELMNTQIRTPDNTVVIIPNSSLTSHKIINYSLKDTRRLVITFKLSHDASFPKVKQLLQTIIEEEPRILKERKPIIAIQALSDNGYKIAVRLWVKSPDHWRVQFDLTERIKEVLDQNGVPFPDQNPPSPRD